ncbi:MAG: AsmA-like C-terminal region-containing protein, partial [Gammaproteobacteria bacterium]|nr:AsmA-like C-terminal region-containing protein [Gammaproteobacteria bacterium]
APGPWPITLSSNNLIDLDAGAIEISDIQLALTPALVQGSVQVQNVLGDASWQAQLTTNTFALNELLDNLLARPEQTTAPQLPGFNVDQPWQTELQLQISGNSSQIELPELIATLGDMRLEMAANVRFANELLPTNVTFDIETNYLDLSPYFTAEPDSSAQLPADDQSFAPDPEATTVFDLAIPESLWSDRNIQGTLSVDSLFVSGIQFGSMNLFAIVESGVLDMELAPTNVLNGSLSGNVRINSIPTRNEVTLELVTDQIDVADLALPFLSPGAVAGRLNLESRFSGTGSTLGEWLDNFGGTSRFSVTDNSVDVSVIKQTFTTIAALSPTGEPIQRWPDVIRFNQFNGYTIFEDGLDDNQQIRLQLDNFDISGNGGIDLNADSFDYNLLFTVLGPPALQTVPVNEQYHGVAWPVQCAARFDDPINQYCRPDLAQVREIFSQLANGTFPENLDEVETGPAPEELPQDTGGLLRDLPQN